MNCKDFKDIADSYLSNELLVETNHEVLQHLETCPNCRAELAGRRELREQLRSAVRNAPQSRLDPAFAVRVKDDLHEQAFGKQWVLSFAGSKAVFAGLAVMLLIAAAIGISVTQRKTSVIASDEGPRPSVGSENLWYEQASFQIVKNDAVDDHRHCALSHDISEKPISLKEANKRFGTAADGLDAAVFESLRAAFGDDAKFLEAHFCLINGRRFSHVILEYKNKVVSVLLTLRDGDGEGTSDTNVLACGTDGDLQVACFESGKYNAFIVSDLTEDDNLLVAHTISESVKKHVAAESKKV